MYSSKRSVTNTVYSNIVSTFKRSAVMLAVLLMTAATAWAQTVTVGNNTYTLFTGFTVDSYYESENVNNNPDENYSKLVDGVLSSEWYVVRYYKEGTSTVSLDFHSTNPIVVKGYILTTGNKVENHSERNPEKWFLRGKLKSTDEWTTIASETSSASLPATNTTNVQFNLESNTAIYQYFQIEMTSIFNLDYREGSMEMGELQLFGFVDNDYQNNITYCTIGNLQSSYPWDNDNVINISDYTVTSINGTTLQKGIDFAESISPSPIKSVGNYTLTLTGIGDYTGTISAPFYVYVMPPTDTNGDYIISDVAAWNMFAASVNNGETYSGKNVKLTTDIGTAQNPITTMVGTEEHPFCGTFDGQGHTLTVNINDNQNQGTAPFRYISDATIKFVKVEGTVTGNMHCAGLVGFAKAGTNLIRNCEVTAYVKSYGTHSGGILGHGLSSATTIADCLFSGTINGSTSATGVIFGWGDSGNHVIENCLADGSYPESNIKLIFSSGKKTINNCYSITDCGGQGYYNSYIMTKDELAAGLGFYWHVKDNKVLPIIDPWSLELATMNGNQPFYELTQGNPINISYSITDYYGTVLTKGSDYNAVITNSSNQEVTTITEIGDYTLTITGIAPYNSTIFKHFFVYSALKPDESGKYLINNESDWESLVATVNSGNVDYSGKTVRLMADINATMTVGTEEYPFSGTFDGMGNTLTVNITDKENQGTAPFRYINDATIQMVRVAGTVSGNMHCAGLVGFAKAGTNYIRNCEVATTVNTCGSHCGGILGHGGSSATTIINCLFSGSINGATTATGIIYGWGDNGNHVIENCLSAGTYSGKGIELIHSGNSQTINNCYRKTNGGSKGTDASQMTNNELAAALGNDWQVNGDNVLPILILPTLETDESGAYLINNESDWNIFVLTVNFGRTDYLGKTVKLTTDISTTSLVGNAEHPFRGTFNGNGKTLTVNINSKETFAAPFCCIDGATIENLTVTGTVTAKANHAAGLVGSCGNNSTNVIKGCTVNTNVVAYGFAGGIVGHGGNGNLTIQDCVYSGTINNISNYAGGLLGWCDALTVTIQDCLFKGSFAVTDDGKYHPIACKSGESTVISNVTNALYLSTITPSVSGNEVIADGAPVNTTISEIWFIPYTAADGLTYYGKLNGSGTQKKPLLLNNFNEWNSFANSVNNGNTYQGLYLKMTADIGTSTEPITTMVGISGHPFSGTIDGDGHTLTINISGTGAMAPFGSINGGKIENLTVTGDVTSTGYHAAGLVGGCGSDSPNTIRNCTVKTNVSAPYAGGIVGHGGHGNLTIDKCVYSGSLSNITNYAGGIIGWCDALTFNINNCLFKGSFTVTGSGKYHPIICKNGGSTVTANVTKALYLNSITATASGNNIITGAEGTPVSTEKDAGQLEIAVKGADGMVYYAAQPITVNFIIGDEGTNTNKLFPTSFSNYSLTQQIYTAEDLGDAGIILNIGFYNTKTECTRNLDIYMAYIAPEEVDKWNTVSAADKVFSGNVTFVVNDWTTIELDKTFLYDGKGNILLVVDDNTGSSPGSEPAFLKCESTFISFGIGNKRNEDPTQTFTISNLIYSGYRNQLRIIKNEVLVIPVPGHLQADEFTLHSATLTWTGSSGNTGYNLRYKASNDDSYQTITDVNSPYALTGLTQETVYDVQVQAVNENGESEWTPAINFSTLSLCSAPIQLNATNIAATSATLNWTGWHDGYNVRYRKSSITHLDENFENGVNNFTGTASIIRSSINGTRWMTLGYTSTETQYLISPELGDYQGTTVVYFIQRYYNSANTFKVGYSSTTQATDAFTWGESHEATSEFDLYYEVIPDGTKYIAIQAQADAQANAVFIDNFTVFSLPGEWVTTTADSPTLTISGLAAETEYDWQVQGNCTSGTTDWSQEVKFTTTPLPDITLADDGTNNVSTIAAYNSQTVNVTLSGRTLYRNGEWNTLCLPFSLSDFTDTPLQGATVKELSQAVFSKGTLMLHFKEAANIQAGKPYIVKWTEGASLFINSTDDWNAFAESVANGNTYAGKTVALTADLSIMIMVGTSEHPFQGTFNGGGHTLNLSLSDTGNGTAPFHYINGATIRNVKTTGSVSGGNYSAGLVGIAQGGTNSIHDCHVNVTVTGSGYAGGVLGNGTTSVTTVRSCLFNGSISATNMAIFYGWGDEGGTHAVANCVDQSSHTLIDIPLGNGTCSVTGSYSSNDIIIGVGNNPYLDALGDQWAKENGQIVLMQNNVLDTNIENPVFAKVIIDADAETSVDFSGGQFVGTYTPLSSIDGLLFDTYNLTNMAFRAALNIDTPEYGELTFDSWFTDAGLTTPVSTIPFADDGTVKLYAKFNNGTATVGFAKEGYGTYYNNLCDAVLPAGMKARIVTAKADGQSLTYETVADGDLNAVGSAIVPAGTAVMLQVAPANTSQSIDLTLTTPSAAAISQDNLLHGSDAATTTTGGDLFYKLSYNTSGQNIGWYWGAQDGGAFTSGAHKAWLALPSSAQHAALRSIGLPEFNEGTTDVLLIPYPAEQIDVWYDMMGRKLEEEPTVEGLYIHNGQTIMIK